MHGAFSHQFVTRPTVAAVVESHKLVTKLLHDALHWRRPLDDAGIPQKDCPRRNGSRTPRSKVRVAVSPEKRHEHARFTPNGTQVPPGPPPSQLDLFVRGAF